MPVPPTLEIEVLDPTPTLSATPPFARLRTRLAGPSSIFLRSCSCIGTTIPATDRSRGQCCLAARRSLWSTTLETANGFMSRRRCFPDASRGLLAVID